jgi:ketosteroid isomerase-like protein
VRDTGRAMSLENEEIVRRLYRAWADDESAPGLLHPEVEYVNPPGAIEPGVRRGIEAFEAAVAATLESWSSWEMEPERLAAVGDRVAVLIRYRATARASGIAVEGRESALLTVRDGTIARYEWFHGPDDAFRALGLA